MFENLSLQTRCAWDRFLVPGRIPAADAKFQSKKLNSPIMNPRIPALACLILFGFGPTSVRSELLIVPSSIYATPGTWGIDIDGDNIEDVYALNELDRVFFHADILEFPSTIGALSPFRNARSTSNPGNFNSLYTAPAQIVLQPASGNTNNGDHGANPLAQSFVLFHGTATAVEGSYSDFVSLLGLHVEPPTSGSFGVWSNEIHDDSYFVFYHNFGRIAAGDSRTLDYTTNVFSVPEPGVSLLMTLGLSSALLKRRRRI
ncbi:PEP-CTERM sorting domain-containing protein [Roseimicrobium sp. ORNL1]|uniref:PEP-CTERM sorting domain-containing protein n=1 Tax=Roseimicrobium sp. ORNL1 TaxID=2711231 RepID=UPI0013E1E8F4|nr:PEP-CTERM sorting domain-containing protein [Roseimicrobium sp. ORNL1]QIF03718.1 PEP-CTERM sorting domain-containing protein [Roseimicrobium sp. ORNL1]